MRSRCSTLAASMCVRRRCAPSGTQYVVGDVEHVFGTTPSLVAHVLDDDVTA